MYNVPIPSDDDPGRTLEEHGGDPAREKSDQDVEDLPETEDLDEADARRRVEQEPEEQKSATDPEYDPDEDAPG